MSQAFSGGIAFGHAVEQKQLTSGLPIENFVPKSVVIPLRQGLGAACMPVVEAGQTVAVGQLVGRHPEDKAPPIHCGVSGRVTAVEERPVVGGKTLCVVVDNDGSDTPAPPLAHDGSPAGIRQLMWDAGLIGMGGAGFPTAFKYRTDKPIRRVLINGCECEPYLTCDHALMLYEADLVVSGAAAMALAAGVQPGDVTICVEDNKADAGARLELAARPAGVQVKTLPTRYPQGGERQLIAAMTGCEVPVGGLPADVGVLVSNAATAAALGSALRGHPLTHRILTVSGLVKRPANLRVPIGTRFDEILAHCGGVSVQPDSPVPLVWIAGGPMTGAAIQQTDVPVSKTTAGLVVLEHPDRTEQNCIRCGGCVRACPSRLMPFAIDAAVIAGNLPLYASYTAQQCISCGCCSYICPAKRFLATRVTLARNTLRKK